mmetsp:Transcript_13795/g.12226  ORF Transcript_13795/g.12226 Transcript_13795/m.12226 type:complete len:90 (+) Transcript_13795:416-685(+)
MTLDHPKYPKNSSMDSSQRISELDSEDSEEEKRGGRDYNKRKRGGPPSDSEESLEEESELTERNRRENEMFTNLYPKKTIEKSSSSLSE